MLVFDAQVWPHGESATSEHLGRIVIGRVGTSAGGDYADYLVIELDATGEVARASLLKRRHVVAGWRDLLWAALDGDEAEPVATTDERVLTVVAATQAGER